MTFRILCIDDILRREGIETGRQSMTQDHPERAKTSEQEPEHEDLADAALSPAGDCVLNDSDSSTYDFEQLAGGAKWIVIRLGETFRRGAHSG